MNHRLDYESRASTRPGARRALQWLFALLAGGAVWWLTTAVVIGLFFEFSTTRAHVLAGWLSVVVIPTSLGVLTVRTLLRDAKQSSR
jgi:hypothetical protein